MFKKISKIISNKTVKNLIIYTDGSCTSNGKSNSRGGIGIFYNTTNPRNISLSFNDAIQLLNMETTTATNNKTELIAVLFALEGNKVWLEDGNNILFKTDSKYVIDSLTKWYHTWLKNDWMNSSNRAVLNRDILEKIVFYIVKYKGQIEFSHVRSHTVAPSVESKDYPDWYGNDIADKLAQLASSKGTLPKETVDKYIKEGW